MRLDDWFLTPAERGNESTALDRRRGEPGEGTAWTEGNDVSVLIDGASYFPRLEQVLRALEPGDRLYFTDWEGHADERLSGPGSEVGPLLADAARRGVRLCGLIWRSHPRQAHFAEQDNLHLARELNLAGAEVVLDERVRRVGSHHQKLVVVWPTPPSPPASAAAPDDRDPVAFIGGIDLCHGRHDGHGHEGDPQAIELDRRYGPKPPWHDIQLEVRGPAVGDLSWTFQERWSDPTPFDHRNPLRTIFRLVTRQPRHVAPLPEDPAPLPRAGTHAVQVLRTYPAKRPPFPFAPTGERSVARAYLKAIARARRLVVIEDQYLWSKDAADALVAAMRAHRDLQVVVIVPRFPDRDGKVSGAAAEYGRARVLERLASAGGARVAAYDLENADGVPIYVHAKACIIDDVWLEIGSDNLNRRSWTHDSEISCALIDEELDTREPADPAGLGDGARRLARATRLALWTEHLGRELGDDADLVDPESAFQALATAATELDDWAQSGRRGPRPPGHLRPHRITPVPAWLKPFAAVMYHLVLDPDGRPRSDRAPGAY